MAKRNIEINGPLHGAVVGDYANVTNYYGNDNFVEITIEELNSREFRPPDNLTDKLLDLIKKERLLVLGDNLGLDKDDLALHLALLLTKEIIKIIPNSANNSTSVKQWKRSLNQQLLDINLEVQKIDSPTIFILSGIRPSDVNYELKKIHKALTSSRKHYIIAITDVSFSSWHLMDADREFFPNLKGEKLYKPVTLVNLLKEEIIKYNINEDFKNKLIEEKDELRQFLQKDSNKNEPIRGLNDFLILIANNLGSSTNIARFAELFHSRNSEEQKIHSLIQLAKNDESFIRHLYYNILKPRDQLLAIGLSLFNGLFEDQLFAALEEVVQNAWLKRDTSLTALDYCDLEQLQDNFFQLIQNDLDKIELPNLKIVKTKSYKVDIRSIKIIKSEDRQVLFKVAWESHRRQIIAVLPVLVELVKESVNGNYINWELYGNRMRCEKLRNVISETLSDLALVSTSATNAVQSALFALAEDKNFQVQEVSAKAIARWYTLDNREGLFKTLQLFYSIALEKEESVKNNQLKYPEISQERKAKEHEKLPDNTQNKKSLIIKTIQYLYKVLTGKNSNAEKNQKHNLKNYYIKKDEDEKDYIGATAALIISYTAQYEYEQGSKISDDLYDWLQELLESRISLVHEYFGFHTLSHVVPLYLKEQKICDLIKKATRQHEDDFLNYAIADSLAQAYTYLINREKVQEMLDEWYNKCIKKWNRHIDRTRITHHDALLKIVALTYGRLDYSGQKDKIHIKDALNRLDEILQKEKHPFVRKGIVEAICDLISRYFDQIEFKFQYDQIESKLQDLVANISYSEREEIVTTFTQIYLLERANLPSGDKEIRVDRRCYQVWIDSKERPLTAIEKVMNNWAKLERKTAAQQIAIQTLVAIALEEQSINELSEEYGYAELYN